jgi:hypothetical protein
MLQLQLAETVVQAHLVQFLVLLLLMPVVEGAVHFLLIPELEELAAAAMEQLLVVLRGLLDQQTPEAVAAEVEQVRLLMAMRVAQV